MNRIHRETIKHFGSLETHPIEQLKTDIRIVIAIETLRRQRLTSNLMFAVRHRRSANTHLTLLATHL